MNKQVILIMVCFCSIIILISQKSYIIPNWNIPTINNKFESEQPKNKSNKSKFKKRVTQLSDCPNETNIFDAIGENVKVINAYKFNVPTKIITGLQLHEQGIKSLTNKGYNSLFPILVTGLSSNHFGEFRQNFERTKKKVLKAFPKMKVIVYDLGLTRTNRKTILTLCKMCTFRTFPFENFPSHVKRLHSYTWKPLAIQMTLQDYDFVIWTDTSIILQEETAFLLFQNTRKHGIQTVNGGGSIAARTSPILFDFLGEEPCDFRDYSEVSGGWVSISRNKFTLQNIMLPWVSCALQFGCMDFPKAAKLLYCPKTEPKIGSCHRFDQSMLGIIISRLYNRDRANVTFTKQLFGIVARQ